MSSEKHYKKTVISTKAIRLRPDSGYLLYNSNTGMLYSDVYCKPAEEKLFTAVLSEDTR